VIPHVDRGLDRGQPLAAGRFRRDRRIVDQRMQLAVLERSLMTAIADNVSCGSARSTWMWSSARFPRAVFRERMARAGDDAPAGGREALHRGMADARLARSAAGRRGWLSLGVTMGYSSLDEGVQGLNMGFRDKAESCSGLAAAAAAELDPIVQPIGPILPEFDGERQQAVA